MFLNVTQMQVKPYYDYEDVIDSDEELDFSRNDEHSGEEGQSAAVFMI